MSVLQRPRSLCANCENNPIPPFSQFSNNEIPEEGVPILSLGNIPRDNSIIECQSCQFFFRLSTKYQRNYKQHVRLFNRIKISQVNSTGRNIPWSPFLSVVRENSRLVFDDRILNEIGQMGLVVEISSPNPKDCPIQIVEEKAIKYDLLKLWIRECQESHPNCQRVDHGPSKLPYLNLIDCTTGTLVRADPAEQYLALSYVWGSQTHQEKESEAGVGMNFHDSRLSRTISDAILAALNLGQRYLWIDKYCIDQSSSAEKAIMIQNMAQIYENASATLVALHGENSSSGLPGVSQVPRIPQGILPTSTGYLISTHPPLSTEISNSKWSTRGWTYQEARLSTRCIFFTSHQVYFACRQMLRSEALPYPSSTNWITQILNSGKLSASIFGISESIPESLFLDRLRFTERELTFESDILDAFRGIISRSRFRTFWGVTILPIGAKLDPCLGLALGLLWIRRPDRLVQRHLEVTKRIYTRRSGLPSWSWTSLKGEIFNEGFGEEGTVFARYLMSSTDLSISEKGANLQFWIPDINGGKSLHLEEALENCQDQHLPETSKFLEVEGDIVKVRVNSNRRDFMILSHDGHIVDNGTTRLDNDSGEEDIEADNNWTLEDALVLVEWFDPKTGQSLRGKRKLRFVMLLLKWIEEGVAERQGILYEYKQQWAPENLAERPRVKKRFLLQ